VFGSQLPGWFEEHKGLLKRLQNCHDDSDCWVGQGTVVSADESGAWDGLHERFAMKRINHQEAYSLDGACTNQAEEYFSRLRRAEIGIHHHIAGAYLLRYAQESSWREDR
jgi:hypothetical protein